MSMSNFLENEVLDAVLSGSVLPVWATVYVALHTADPTEVGNVGEVTGGSYARVAVTNNLTQWPAASGGSKSNANAVNFPTPTVDWGNVGWFTIWDAASAGNCLLISDELAAHQTINVGNTVSFAGGAIVVSAN